MRWKGREGGVRWGGGECEAAANLNSWNKEFLRPSLFVPMECDCVVEQFVRYLLLLTTEGD